MVDRESRTLLTTNKTFCIPNFLESAEMLEWAGVSFGEEDTYKLSKAMKRLAVMSGASRLNFFGKVFGTKKDYWVIMGALEGAEEVPTDKTIEKRGEGVNKTVFWVTDNLLNDWVQLPDLKPEHIKCARNIKHIFTGDLNESICSNPAFPGKERHLLRAQLARIAHAAMIVPKGLFELDEETNEMKFAEDFTMPATDELKSLETWGNLHPIILKAGRTTHFAPTGMEEEERDALLESLNEKDPTQERFRALNEHTPMPGLEFSWLSKVVGDQ